MYVVNFVKKDSLPVLDQGQYVLPVAPQMVLENITSFQSWETKQRDFAANSLVLACCIVGVWVPVSATALWRVVDRAPFEDRQEPFEGLRDHCHEGSVDPIIVNKVQYFIIKPDLARMVIERLAHSRS